MIEQTYIFDGECERKLQDYYSTKETIMNFKYEFLECTDSDKNDALYFNVHEDAQNQYFGILSIDNHF
jgi:hypothetical protein